MFPEKHFKHIKISPSLQVPRVLELEVLRNHFYHFHSVEKWANSLPLVPWAKERVSRGFTGPNRQRPACLPPLDVPTPRPSCKYPVASVRDASVFSS